jgi:BirA family biotin operon repressor/biotin-[acetyl-CoA-carboxylase] ligase
MRILADCKEQLTGFVPAETAWRETGISLLAEPEQGLWRVLAADGTAWTTDRARTGSRDFWRRIVFIGDAQRSQFDALHDAVCDGLVLDGPTAVIALSGRDFRGQRGRSWSISPGNLFLTVGIPMGAPAEGIVPGLIMLPAVAAVDAIRAVGGGAAAPSIKWVNDVLIDGRKVAGVLTATVCRGDRIESVVLGLGVNVASAPAVEHTPFVPDVGCLADSGVEVTFPDFTWHLLDSLAAWYGRLLEAGPAELLDRYREASCLVGRRVRIWDDAAEGPEASGGGSALLAAGVVESIEADLSLKIREAAAPVTKGRLALEEACVAFGL